MRKGFTLTLMAVAIGMLGTQAQAMAPTIADIPSPIVGNLEPVTGGGTNGNFVYLDAIDLDLMATDDVTAPSALMWTYTGSGTDGASNYLINGVNPIKLGTGAGSVDPTSPSLANLINRNDLDPVPGKDSLKNTITIRNKALSPLPFGTAGTNPGVTGIVPAQTQPVTFFCSDGNALSSETVFFYTDNGQNDRLSGGDPFKIVVFDKIATMWATNPAEWAPGGDNTITRTAGAGGGVCLNGALTGNNAGSVITAMPYFNLAANQVYRFKMKMSCSNASASNMPFWDIVLENYEPNTGKGLNLYIMDTKVFANEGAANALTPTPSMVTWYWTPPAVTTPQWNNASTGAFTAARDSVNDPRLRFRMLDYDMVPESQSNLKAGAVCLLEVEVAAAAITRATTVGSPVVNIASLTEANTAGTGNVAVAAVVSAANIQTAFSGGKVTITPVGTEGGQKLELVTVQPQAKPGATVTDPDSADAGAHWPIAWKAGEILRLQVALDAPTAADQSNPWDAYILLFSSMTNEVNMESYQTSNQAIGSPQVGSPQTYTAFYNTGAVTKSSKTSYQRLRWMFRVTNSDVANFPNGSTRNTGAVRVNSIKVDKVIFK